MKKHYRTGLSIALCATALLFGSTTWADSSTADGTHSKAIQLFDENHKEITADGTKAFSMHKTCNTGTGCHDTKAIERHSYHAQLGANQHMGWNPFKYGNWNSVAPKKKPWVQSPGHVGKW